MIDESSSLSDICFAIAGALHAAGMTAVLCGGSAAAFYAPQKYMSYDADFVLDEDDDLDDVARALDAIGFKREGRSRIFSHPATRFTVDFPKGPLGIGSDYVRTVNTVVDERATLRIVTRNDCVRDRLAHFYFWNDYTALNAAVAVAKAGIDEIDLRAIREWTEREDSSLLEKFDEFKRRVVR